MNPICITCGTQFGDSVEPPEHCPICEDERQYVGLNGQRWTTLGELSRDHTTEVQGEEPSLDSYSIKPRFGIGQRAFVLRTPECNVLWDCLSLLDDTTISRIREQGGLRLIAISHPHYYTSMIEWSRAFGNIPVFLHRDDQRWVMRPDRSIQFWDGETLSLPGALSLIRCGGHFDGATVLHWHSGAQGLGVLLSGDTIQVAPDRRSVSFMYSYPNYIPLDRAAVARIAGAVEPFAFDRIYGAFPKLTIASDGKEAIRRSVARYLRAIGAP